jgi:hypothetical protein
MYGRILLLVVAACTLWRCRRRMVVTLRMKRLAACLSASLAAAPAPGGDPAMHWKHLRVRRRLYAVQISEARSMRAATVALSVLFPAVEALVAMQSAYFGALAPVSDYACVAASVLLASMCWIAEAQHEAAAILWLCCRSGVDALDSAERGGAVSNAPTA